LELHQAVASRFEELLDRIVLAETAHLRKRPGEVKTQLGAARALAEALDARTARVLVALAEARMADAEEDSPRVLASLRSVAPDLGRGDYTSEWESESFRARAFLRLDRLDSAVVAGRRAVATVERVRGSLASGVLRTAYGASRSRTYADLVTILLRAGRPEEAFQVADAARGGGLREHVAAATEAVALDATASGLAEGEALLRRVEQLTRSLDEYDATPPEERDAEFREAVRLLSDRLSAARREYEAHLVRVAEGSPRSAALLGVRTAKVEEIRAKLSPEEALLEYLVLPDRVLIFVLTSDELRVAEAPLSAENLTSRVRLASGLLRDPSSARRVPTVQVLSRLYQALLEPAVRTGALGGASRLLVVPHGVLAYLPIAALLDPVTGRHVVEDYSVLYLPAASTLVLRGAGEVRGAASAAAGGAGKRSRGPAIPAASGVQAFAPFPREFPATEQEARGVGSAFSASVRTGDHATERQVRRALSRSAAVHIATHGVMNARNPMFSRVELAPGRGTAEDDGRIEVHEVLGFAVRAPLVFLSGCETGRGTAWSTEFEQGEDYATLDRAFLYAGAGAVVATLWRVEDEGAAAFAERFYEEARSASAPEALAAAQRSLLKGGKWTSPFYWAAYRVSGL
ncbi:MAG: CHAT domain-containing protein, partial [Gemmatimonadota bacterium]